MKKAIVFIFFTSTMLQSTGQHSKSEYFIAFCSEEISKSAAGGHAFITIGKGEPFTCNIDGGDGEAFGLYAADFEHTDCVPSKFNALASYFVGELPGCLFNDIRTSFDNYLVLRCTFEEYLLVQTEIEKWKRKNYELKKQDCLTFVIEVAKFFNYRLTVPTRSGIFDNFPNQYILKLKSLNKGD